MTNHYEWQATSTRIGRDEFHAILIHAKKIGASDIHIQTNTRLMMRIHGDMRPVTARPLVQAELTEILRVLYGGENGDLQLRTGQPINDAYSLKVDRGNTLRFRWNATGCEVAGGFGMKFVLRELPENPPDLPVDDLGEHVVDALYPDEGLIFVCGATGSGKSTLLAGAIKHRLLTPDARENIMEASSPIEFVYDKVLARQECTSSITQHAVPAHIKSFSAAVENFLRQDPDRLIIGESRDAPTIKAANLAAQTGHALYSTLHANSVSVALLRVLQSLPAEEQAAELGALISSSKLFICQKLLPAIGGGRVAVRETLVLDDAIRRRLLRASQDLSQLPVAAAHIVEEAGMPMHRHARALADGGRIDPLYAEVMERQAREEVASIARSAPRTERAEDLAA